GTWKLSQLKNLSFEEVKEEFDKLVKQVESFAPINFEATKDSLKRFGEELQTKTSKRLKSDEEKDVESTKTGKRRKHIARKGLHYEKTDKDDFEDSDEASEQDDSASGTKIPINPVPIAMKSPSIATYKIIKQGEKGVYQIVKEDGTDIVYINFGAMLKDITRDDLTELYRIVMNRYGMNGPEDELENVLWEYLKNMFEEPLSTDPIWSLLGQQKIISWRYYTTCRVHCLNLESSDIYMLIERQYPLTAEVCKAMLDKKLQRGKPNEDCYKLLKWMEKHKDWLVQEQTTLGKDFSNPLMAENLPKIVWFSTHHIERELGVRGRALFVGQFITKIDRKVNLLTDEVLNGLSVSIYCSSLDTTTLRELSDSNGRLIVEEVAPGWVVWRFHSVSWRGWHVDCHIILTVPKALISDKGTHFCNSQLEKALQKYEVTHKLSTAYHSQSNGQSEVTNKEIEHKALWALKQCNMDLMIAGKNHFTQLNELAKLRDGAYESTIIYKEWTKKWHDSRLRGDKDFTAAPKKTKPRPKLESPYAIMKA
ncbi:reverse transcriptase domain-containing protein, partial [Tanacetum coccineum]